MSSSTAANALLLDLTYGQVVINLYRAEAPKTVSRLVSLCNQAFYDGLLFHRVIDGFVAQGGDPAGNGYGYSHNNSGQIISWNLPTLDAEFSTLPFDRGAVAMARSASNINSATTQFFIDYTDLPSLYHQYTIWGHVLSGMRAVDQLHRVSPTPWSAGALPPDPPANADEILHMRAVTLATLTGSSGNDQIEGGSTGETLNGGAGADTLLGGGGNDTYLVDSRQDQVYETTVIGGTKDAGGVDQVRSSVSWTLGRFVENLALIGSKAISGTGNTLANRLIGNSAANSLSGGGGNDFLVGNGGADVLQGQSGADTLSGGDGVDTLSGGAGADLFRFTSPTEGTDRITDFTPSQGDELGFVATGFGRLSEGPLATSRFRASAGGQATTSTQRFLFDTTHGILRYDSDGTGPHAAIPLATLGVRSLAADDLRILAS